AGGRPSAGGIERCKLVRASQRPSIIVRCRRRESRGPHRDAWPGYPFRASIARMSYEYGKLWALDREVAFLNHGSFRAVPAPGLPRPAELRPATDPQPPPVPPPPPAPP